MGLNLLAGLTVWPKFIELCERRNLFTHTGGVVSQQYLSICADHKCDITNISLGQRLRVQPKYLRGAIRIVYEIGIKLLYVLWRKFDPKNIGKIDLQLNEISFNLIVRKQYRLAESLLQFAADVTKKTGTDYIHKVITVNLANAVRLQNRKRRP